MLTVFGTVAFFLMLELSLTVAVPDSSPELVTWTVSFTFLPDLTDFFFGVRTIFENVAGLLDSKPASTDFA